MEKLNPFLQNRRIYPENGWEILKWLIFEPTRLEEYDGTLDPELRKQIFFQTYWRYILPISFFIYIIFCLIAAYTELPVLFITSASQDFETEWLSTTNFFSKFRFLFEYELSRFIWCLIFCFGAAVFVSFKENVQIKLNKILITSILCSILSLIECLENYYTHSFMDGFILGLLKGFAIGLVFGLCKELSGKIGLFKITEIGKGDVTLSDETKEFFAIFKSESEIEVIFSNLVNTKKLKQYISDDLIHSIGEVLSKNWVTTEYVEELAERLTKELKLLWNDSSDINYFELGLQIDSKEYKKHITPMVSEFMVIYVIIWVLVIFIMTIFKYAIFYTANLGLAFGLILSFVVGYLITAFGLWQLLTQQTFSLVYKTFDNNSFLHNERLAVIPFGVSNSLLKQAQDDPNKALYFAEFLLKHRPLQYELAAKIIHTAHAALWYNAPLHEKQMKPPIIPKSQVLYQPSEAWKIGLTKTKNSWVAVQQASNQWLKQEKYSIFQEDLKDFVKINRNQSPLWARYYYAALEKWVIEADETFTSLRQNNKGTVRNPYRTGLALTTQQDENIFLGRQKLRDQLHTLIVNSPELPLFLIHGQRRVGKTSLLNFLQTILGEYYIVVRQDLQGTEDCITVEHWLTVLRQKINQALGLPPDGWQATDDWLTSWEALRQHLTRVMAANPKKLILAWDEYEGLHDKCFLPQPQKAHALLGALRSFAQSQRDVVFLFLGAHYFFELENPDWSAYFVHSQYLEVDYLTQLDSIQLVTQPYPDFPIQYPPTLPVQIYEATQGHPALLQQIGHSLVTLANAENRLQLTDADWQQVLQQHIFHENNNTIGNFWRGFCKDWRVQETVLRIAQGKNVPDSDVKVLLRHRFILKIAENRYQMRVPLFRDWVLKLGA